jgi:hypothetical protein
MKSKIYNKFRRSKYKFRTKITKGTRSGKSFTKGKNNPGSIKARAHIEKEIGRELNVHHTEHNVGEYVFVELK